jgi:hypothetical protein
MTAFAKNGPTDVDQPVFAWNERNGAVLDTPHFGQPDSFHFDYVPMCSSPNKKTCSV